MLNSFFGISESTLITPTPVVNLFVTYEKVFTPDQISNFDQSVLTSLAQTKFPVIRRSYPSDKTRDVYTVECQVTKEGFSLEPNIVTIENNSKIYQSVLTKLVTSPTSSFPNPKTIAFYQGYGHQNFKNKNSGINGVKDLGKGIYAVNFFDSVKAFGGGASTVDCYNRSVNLTLQQFPEVKKVILCIDQYPNSKNHNCASDFQP